MNKVLLEENMEDNESKDLIKKILETQGRIIDRQDWLYALVIVSAVSYVGILFAILLKLEKISEVIVK